MFNPLDIPTSMLTGLINTERLNQFDELPYSDRENKLKSYRNEQQSRKSDELTEVFDKRDRSTHNKDKSLRLAARLTGSRVSLPQEVKE